MRIRQLWEESRQRGIIVRDKVKCKGPEMGQGWTWRNREKVGVMNVGSKGEKGWERKARPPSSS